MVNDNDAAGLLEIAADAFLKTSDKGTSDEVERNTS